MKSFFLVAFLLNVTALVSSAQTVTTGSTELMSVTEKASLQKSIDAFLNQWLVKKNNKRALEYFSEKAFTNKEMLGEDCVGVINRDKASDPKVIKRGVTEFLKDFNQYANGASVDAVLSFDVKVLAEPDHKKFVLNVPQNDKYWLFRASPALLKQSVFGEYRDKYLIENVFMDDRAALWIKIRLKEKKEEFFGAFYFIWIQEKETWKIIHAGMECM